MNSTNPSYMNWAKTHPRAKYELTASGVAPAGGTEFDGYCDTSDLHERGTYGDPDLIRAIGRFRGVDEARVLPVPGTSCANFIALAAVAAAGDRVLIESPAYDPLLRVTRFLGLQVLRFDRWPDRDWRPDLQAVRAGLREGAVAVVLTNLHNPSGRLCPADDTAELAAMTAEYGARLIVDEVYLDYAALNAGRARSSAIDLGEQVLVTDSLTKVYGLGGLRAGWLIAEPQVLRRAQEIVDLLHVVNPVVSAHLAVQALANVDRLGERCREYYRAAHPILARWLADHPDLKACGNDGALFEWIRLPDGVRSDVLVHLLAAEYETNIVPGGFFGCDDYIRIGFGLVPAELAEGLARVGAALVRLRAGGAVDG
ncbi:MAG: pyridoxal phosphate-dependent aminotransferase [bacterium]|nr:pyridoxal phosphate-dependent aminotransferase [bacterium]